MCAPSVNDPGPGHPLVQGKAATAKDAIAAIPSASAAGLFSKGAKANAPSPKMTIPEVTIQRFGAPSSASLLIASSAGS